MSQPINEARILLALQALQNNPKLSIRRAADMYEVNRNTLRRHQNGNQSRCDWR
jgi:predicted DNA-binding transcriptional regulator YafY